MFSLSKLGKEGSMTTEEIKRNFILGKMGIQFHDKKIVLFYKLGSRLQRKKEVFTTTYKPKVWIECNFKDFFFSPSSGQGTQKNFRYHGNYFTEEKATEENSNRTKHIRKKNCSTKNKTLPP